MPSREQVEAALDEYRNAELHWHELKKRDPYAAYETFPAVLTDARARVLALLTEGEEYEVTGVETDDDETWPAVILPESYELGDRVRVTRLTPTMEGEK